MSFTAEVKDELSRVPATCTHCDKATLAALVRIEGTLFFSGQGTYRIEIATDVPSVARLIIKLLHELYHLKTELTVRRSVLHKTPNYLIEVPAQPHLADALRDMGVLSRVFPRRKLLGGWFTRRRMIRRASVQVQSVILKSREGKDIRSAHRGAVTLDSCGSRARIWTRRWS